MRVAVLDDYQGVAREMADWSSLGADFEIVSFRDHLADHDAIAQRLQDFEVIVAMRERTPFPRALLEKLPRLRLLVSTGMRNASIDLAAARERGVVVCGTPRCGRHDRRADLGPDPRALPADSARRPRAARRQLADHGGPGLAGKTLGIIGLGTIGCAGSEGRRGVQHGSDRLEPEPDAERAGRAGARARSSATSCSRARTWSPSTSCWASARAG